jgi:hypothetical protein
MDHIARFAIHKKANVCPGWRFRLGFPWKHCCLHNFSPQISSAFFKVSVQHVQGTGVNETLTQEGTMAVHNYDGRRRWLMAGDE